MLKVLIQPPAGKFTAGCQYRQSTGCRTEESIGKENCHGRASVQTAADWREGPVFQAETTQGLINFPEDFKGKWVVFFSHPADFTPVCTTEFMTFASMQPEFEKLDCKLLDWFLVLKKCPHGNK